MTYTAQPNDKVSKFSQFFYDAYRTWGVFYSAAYRDLRAYAGQNWTQSERAALEQQKRMVLELNKIRRVVNLYSGYERENRLSTVCDAVEDSDVDTADLISDVMIYTYEKGNAHHVISDAFEHSLKTGLAIIGIYIDYGKDKVNGDIKFYYKPFNAIMLDPYFTKRDLSDCDQASTRDLLSREQVKSLLPWVDPQIIENIPTGIRDNKYQYLGIYRQYNSTYIAKNLLTYDQYWTRINKPQKYLVDMDTGVSQEWNGTPEEEKHLKEALAMNQNVQMINSYKRDVELNIIVGGRLLYSGPDPTGLSTFPFLPVIAYFEPLIDTYELKIQGIVRSIVDAQRQYNRRHSQIIDLMESIINTGWISRNGAVLDPQMLLQSGQARNIIINEGYDVNADIREIQPPQVPSGYLQYQDIIDKNIMEIPGGSEELLGISSTGDSQVSGRLAEVRASNGLKGNRGLFDNLEQTLSWLGNLVIEAIQKNYTPGKIWRITKREPTPEFFSGEFGKYDSCIKQAVLTHTQREAYYYQLLQLRELGIAIPDDIIVEAAPLQGKVKLNQRMAEIAERQQEAQQIEMQQIQRQAELENAQIDNTLALAQERRARVLADIGLARERISEGEQNYAKALLDNAKTVAEIEDLDRGHLLEVMRLAHDMQSENAAKTEEKLQADRQLGESFKAGEQNG
ncbi:MAG: hypothetical protein EPO09_21720 [Aquabacterium sp.]|uniref:portal protein n=1 Tax=Aquabacterium sp. TaxID=1872578 RepID=UPI00120BC7AA|nr:hypothetical protein [Aquabacterium sp.]TAK82094.1 MAG: hypothetical protein EPO09_21720 [Aquabacterium sp.]